LQSLYRFGGRVSQAVGDGEITENFKSPFGRCGYPYDGFAFGLESSY
jgi:hypothetical protein